MGAGRFIVLCAFKLNFLSYFFCSLYKPSVLVCIHLWINSALLYKPCLTLRRIHDRHRSVEFRVKGNPQSVYTNDDRATSWSIIFLTLQQPNSLDGNSTHRIGGCRKRMANSRGNPGVSELYPIVEDIDKWSCLPRGTFFTRSPQWFYYYYAIKCIQYVAWGL